MARALRSIPRLLCVPLACLFAVATTLGAQTTGGYGSLARRATARSITLTRPVDGRLTAADPTFADGSHFQVWKFSASAGDDIAIALSSPEFDAFLMIVAASGASEQPLQMAMADSATRVAQLAFRIPADGEYLIVANTLAAQATGRYRLTLRGIRDACAAGGPCSVPGTTGGITRISALSPATAKPIALGATENGELTTNDLQLGDSSRFNVWRYDGRAGERLVIDQASKEFDSYLMLARPSATGPALFRENDDAPWTLTSPAGENSQIAVELPETGAYLIIATSYRPNTTGRYQLTLRSMEAACAAGGPCEPTPPPVRRTFFSTILETPSPTIALGDTIWARLGARDRSVGDGTRFKAYRFSGRANDEIAIFLDAQSPDATRFDPFLHLLKLEGDSLGVVATDDDGGGQRNSLITARLPVSGEYFIVANGLTVADTGNFSVAVMRLADACRTRRVCTLGGDLRRSAPEVAVRAAPAQPIAMGGSVTGQFDPGSSRFADGKPFAVWRYTARAGERAVITNRSDEFDAYLMVYAIRGDSTIELARDDDGAGGLHAQIAIEFASAGEYLLVPGSYVANAQGTYRLSLESMDAACAAGGPCAPGETAAATARLLPALRSRAAELPARGTLRGSLTASTPKLERGGRFQTYRFRGRAGERIVITMASTDFDAYLHLAQIRGAGLRVVGDDDDSGSGTDARLVATLPANAEYLVVASALDGSDSTGVGAFTIQRAACDDACAAYRDVPGMRSEAVFQPARLSTLRRVTANGTAAGSLDASADTLMDGSPFHAYAIDLRPGQSLRATLKSSDFDAYVVLLRVDRDRLVLVGTDDDGAGGTDAKLELAMERAGRYVVLVTAFGREAAGQYALELQAVPASGTLRP